MSNVRSRIVGLAALLILVALVFVLPAVLLAIDAVPTPEDFAWSRLAGPDDGTLAVAVLGVVAWLAWLVLSASVMVELVARVRGIRPPRLPGLAVPQLTAGRLVALASLLFVAVPAAAQAIGSSRAVADTTDSTEQRPPTHIDAQASAEPPPPLPPAAQRAHADAEPSVPYTVKRGDSLWKIAETQLGDGRRYGELVTLNSSVLDGRPDFITPGTVLRVPVERRPSDDAPNNEYLVQPGDTLSGIAEAELGEARLYPGIYAASREIEQAHGQRLDDPDLILPGWRLTVPQAEEPHAVHRQPKIDQPPPPRQQHPPVIADPPERRDEAADRDHGLQPAVDDAESDEGSSPPTWALPGLMGAGAVLAGALLLVLRQHRRTQLRYRRPGRAIEPPPDELRPVEKTAQLVGSVAAPAISALDHALRDLAAKCANPPQVLVVRLGKARISVHLAQPADLPAPWAGSGRNWSVEAPAEVAAEPDQIAPYPLLVSVGQDTDSDLVLLNLEDLRSVSLAGESVAAEDLGRHLAAELALNPWSNLVEIDMLGIGAELASIDPVRMRHHNTNDTAFLKHLAAAVESESGGDPDPYRAVLTTGEHSGDLLRRTAKVITHSPTRSGVVVVTLNNDPEPGDVVLHLTPQGRLVVDKLELEVKAAGLSADEAAACAAIVDLTRTADDKTAPPARTTDGQQSMTNVAGALLPERTQPRPEGPAGPTSLLPLATADYVEFAATTTGDVETLAPVLPASTRDGLRVADATLDDDLALWSDPDARVPRLTLLGRVDARAYGNPRAVVKRKPFYVELLAYLALHPDGVSSREMADAFGLTVPRTRTDIGVVRSWLGTDPRSGEPHLPSANAGTASGNGAQRYQVRGLLVDVDLFRRLRTRAQTNGSDGIDDLKAALGLVTGEPFSRLRPAGWSWLLDGDRLDHIMTCAVADVGHILTTYALSAGNLDLARWSAETSIKAAPYDDVCRLDLIKVAAESGHIELARRQLVDEVLNRSDDGLGPVDLPSRTANVFDSTHWGTDRGAE